MSRPFARTTLAATLLALAACKPTVPDKYIQPDKMEDILYDYHLSQGIASQGPGASFNRNLYYQETLRKHGVSEAEFDSSLVFYYSDVQRLHQIYKRVSERLGAQAVSLGASVSEVNKYSSLTADGDTANIWREAEATALITAPPYNRLDFAIEADTTFRRGDSFLFRLNADFLYQSGTKDATAYIAVTYSNDSVAATQRRISSAGLAELRVPMCRDFDIKRIAGFVYLNRGTDKSRTLKLMFIDRMQLIRFHRPKDVVEREARQKAVADSIAAAKRDTTTLRPDTTRRPAPKIAPRHNTNRR